MQLLSTRNPVITLSVLVRLFTTKSQLGLYFFSSSSCLTNHLVISTSTLQSLLSLSISLSNLLSFIFSTHCQLSTEQMNTNEPVWRLSFTCYNQKLIKVPLICPPPPPPLSFRPSSLSNLVLAPSCRLWHLRWYLFISALHHT